MIWCWKYCPTQKLSPKSFTALSDKYLQCILISLAMLLLCALWLGCAVCAQALPEPWSSCADVMAAWYQGSWWCCILRSGVPWLCCSWGRGSARQPREKCCKRRGCSVPTWLECPGVGASFCSLPPLETPGFSDREIMPNQNTIYANSLPK